MVQNVTEAQKQAALHPQNNGPIQGNQSSEIIYGQITDSGDGLQMHIYAKRGDDYILLGFVDDQNGYARGHHVYADPASKSVAGLGEDTFHFVDLDHVGAGDVVFGRLDDFDPTRDTIRVGELDDYIELDLQNLPTGAELPADVASIRVVAWAGGYHVEDAVTGERETQQWLMIETAAGGTVMYALEGARVDVNGTGVQNAWQEFHFIPKEYDANDYLDVNGNVIAEIDGSTFDNTDLSALPDVAFEDPQNTIPLGYENSADPQGLTLIDLDIAGSDYSQNVGTNSPINGSGFKDVIAAGLNDDVVNAGAGDDYVWGGTGSDTIKGDAGADELWGGMGHDSIEGGNGDDTIHGGSGDDVLKGMNGNNTVFGGSGDDFVSGWGASDSLDGGSGNDELYGNKGNDNLVGGDGNDTINGGDGNDVLLGERGKDILYGGAGDDMLDGGYWKDTIDGGTGDDTLLGGDGHDDLTGGVGQDVFVFNVGDGYDVIHDFDGTKEPGNSTGDLIDLSGTDIVNFSDLLGRIDDHNGALRITYNGGTITVENYTVADVGWLYEPDVTLTWHDFAFT